MSKKKKSEAVKVQAPVELEKFVVPFAWEASKDEPLALTRAFMRDALSDNEGYMEHADKLFTASAEKQTPRATVVTCADSQVADRAWDGSPENDDFTIRDMGNQIESLEGSVEYGITTLETPLLLIIGHTGCSAVKAAMGDTSKLSAPIQKELARIKLPPPALGKPDDSAWAKAVVANVNNQVDFALRRFGPEVHEGKVTVVGAVYDLRNELGQGAGKLVIVNVNGNSDPERLTSFVEAVNGRAEEAKNDGKESKEHESKDKDSKEKPASEKQAKGTQSEQRPPVKDIAGEMAKIRGLSGVQVSGSEGPLAHVAAREDSHEAASHEH